MVEDGELPTAIPIVFWSPLDGSPALNSLMLCRRVGDMNPHRHPPRRMVWASRNQLQTNAVSLEYCQSITLARFFPKARRA